MSTIILTVDVKNVLSALKWDAELFTSTRRIELKDGKERVTGDKPGSMLLLGETRNELPINPENLVLGLGGIVKYVSDNPLAAYPSYLPELAETVIAVAAASAYMTSAKAGFKAKAADKNDKIVKSVADILVGHSAKKAEAMVNGATSVPTEAETITA